MIACFTATGRNVGPTVRTVRLAGSVSAGGCAGGRSSRRCSCRHGPAQLGPDRFSVRTGTRLRQLLGVLLGYDHVARDDRVVRTNGLKCLRPAFARPPAAAGRAQGLSILEGGRKLRIQPPVQRNGLSHFLARVVIRVERDLCRRAHALAGLLIVAEMVGRGRIGNRKIESVAGPHADRTECPAHRSLRS